MARSWGGSQPSSHHKPHPADPGPGSAALGEPLVLGQELGGCEHPVPSSLQGADVLGWASSAGWCRNLSCSTAELLAAHPPPADGFGACFGCVSPFPCFSGSRITVPLPPASSGLEGKGVINAG